MLIEETSFSALDVLRIPAPATTWSWFVSPSWYYTPFLHVSPTPSPSWLDMWLFYTNQSASGYLWVISSIAWNTLHTNVSWITLTSILNTVNIKFIHSKCPVNMVEIELVFLLCSIRRLPLYHLHLCFLTWNHQPQILLEPSSGYMSRIKHFIPPTWLPG